MDRKFAGELSNIDLHIITKLKKGKNLGPWGGADIVTVPPGLASPTHDRHPGSTSHLCSMFILYVLDMNIEQCKSYQSNIRAKIEYFK